MEGLIIKPLQELNGLSLKDVTEKCGVTQASLRNVIFSGGALYIADLIRFCRLFKIDFFLFIDIISSIKKVSDENNLIAELIEINEEILANSIILDLTVLGEISDLLSVDYMKKKIIQKIVFEMNFQQLAKKSNLSDFDELNTAEKLKNIRKKHKISQSDLSKSLQINMRKLRGIEVDASKFSLDELLKYKEFFNLDDLDTSELVTAFAGEINHITLHDIEKINKIMLDKLSDYKALKFFIKRSL